MPAERGPRHKLPHVAEQVSGDWAAPKAKAAGGGRRGEKRLASRPRHCRVVWQLGSDRFLEFLGGTEGDFLASLDLDRFARGRIAAHARGALAGLQNAQ